MWDPIQSNFKSLQFSSFKNYSNRIQFNIFEIVYFLFVVSLLMLFQSPSNFKSSELGATVHYSYFNKAIKTIIQSNLKLAPKLVVNLEICDCFAGHVFLRPKKRLHSLVGKFSQNSSKFITI